MALIGKAALIADVGYLVPGAQARFGVFHPRDVEKTARRQPGIAFKGPY